MKRRFDKKLLLRRETLRALQSQDLSLIAGGTFQTETCSDHCRIESYCICTDPTWEETCPCG